MSVEEGQSPPVAILVVDDDQLAAEGLATFLRASGFQATAVSSGREALERLAARDQSVDPETASIGVVLTDVVMPGMDGIELIEGVRQRHPDVVCIAVTGYGTVEGAVRAIRAGAIDYLTKPVVDHALKRAVETALQEHYLVSPRRNAASGRGDGLDSIVGSDPRMLHLYEVIEAVAPTRTTVLMTGESGTGKSLIARAIHRASTRADRPFVELSCGSIPETLLESELFGHVKGSFTGAHADKVGRFVAAHGGTIFLDEINSASPGMQLKLLRVLQERRLEPVGSNETIEVDVRVILAANEPLEDLVAQGRFRNDLYYRINVVSLELPPLRDRIGDIPHLARHFLERHARELGRQIAGFSEEAMAALCRYTFPGNVRELQNIVERAAVLCRGGTIRITDLPAPVATPERMSVRPSGACRTADDQATDAGIAGTIGPLAEAIQAPERAIILRALEANGWNRQRTAEQLAINRTTLYKKMRAHGLDRLDRLDRAG